MEKQHPQYPHLFWPLTIGKLILNNRIGLAPMTRTSAEENGVPSARMLDYYSRYASGGFGLLISEGTYPDEAYSQGYFHQPGIANRQHIEGWKKITEKVHEAGSRMICQLMHAGALSQGNIYQNKTKAPSAVLPKGEQLGFYGGEGAYPMPEEMSHEDIRQVTQGFVHAALNARDAGFDGVEIHGANGYLLDQFLTDYTNQRIDEYGGSTENRVRLLVEVCQAVREAVGTDFPVGIRISQAKVNDYTHKWAGGEQDAKIIFSRLGKSGIDFLHVTEYHAHEPAFEAQGPSLASLAKKWGQLPVIANGNLNTPELAEALLANEEVDLVAVGKAALANKDWADKAAKGAALEEFNAEKFFHPDAKIKEFEL
jgi:2,4-dienoyl-CoA reductase-like NADH-dependent reductase (Old Yellow Enzyme family)